MPKVNEDKAEYLHNEEIRQNKKSCTPTDNEHPDRFITGLKKYSDAGKGDAYRDIPGWFNQETTDRLKRIFNKNGKEGSQEKKGELEEKNDEKAG